MSVPTRKLSLNAVTTGTGTAIDTGLYPYVTIYLIGAGTISAGTVVIEEADTQTYAGTWSQIGSPIVVTSLSGGAVLAVHLTPGTYTYIRVRVTSNITGGGTITAATRGVD